MTKLFCILLTLLFSLSGPAMGEYSDFGQSSNAPKTGPSSLYDDVTSSGSRYVNRATDVSKADFERNLVDAGWTRSAANKTVGRHMSPDELAKMQKTGRVQEGGGGQTRVADPADPNTYKNAPEGDVYVEFDVPANRVLPHSTGTGRIPGPNSPDARVPGRNASDYEMPPASNIRVPRDE